MNIYDDLRERALKTPNSQFIKVPITPSIGMILAAADATDVFRPGDTLWHYFSPFEEEYGASEENIYLHPSVVARFGPQKAYVMAIIADTWSNCLEGMNQLFTSRARNPRGFKDKEDILTILPDRCPAGGYPETKADCTDEHRASVKCRQEPFKGFYLDWYNLDRETMFVAPRNLPYYAANVAARLSLSPASFLEFSDVLDYRKIPFVPFFSYEGAFTEEERGELLIAVIWRACMDWLLQENREDAEPFPRHNLVQSVLISNMLFRHHDLWRHVPDFFDKFPFNRIAIYTDRALLTIASPDGETSYSYEERGSDRRIQSYGIVLNNGYDQSGLWELLSKMSSMKIEKVEAIPLSEPW